jgi:excisionase family DNA binding protein
MPTATVMQFPTINPTSIGTVDPPEAAALLKVSVKTLIKMAASGEIPSRRAGRLWRFSAPALERWMNEDAA